MPSPEMGEMDPKTAAQTEFDVDLDDDRAVYQKVIELAHEANRTGRYENVNRLNALFEVHTGRKAEEIKKVA